MKKREDSGSSTWHTKQKRQEVYYEEAYGRFDWCL